MPAVRAVLRGGPDSLRPGSDPSEWLSATVQSLGLRGTTARRREPSAGSLSAHGLPPLHALRNAGRSGLSALHELWGDPLGPGPFGWRRVSTRVHCIPLAPARGRSQHYWNRRVSAVRIGRSV